MVTIAVVNAIVAVLAGLLTALGPWWIERQQRASDERRAREAQMWASLTDADREWFHANYWDGEKVLDERRTE